AQLAVVPVEIRSWSERRDQELRELAQAVAKRPSVARQRCVATRDCLEVFRRAACHLEHVSRRRAQLERAAPGVAGVIANRAHHIAREAVHPHALQETSTWASVQPAPIAPKPGRSHGPSPARPGALARWGGNAFRRAATD